MTFHSSATQSRVFGRPTTPAARTLCLLLRHRIVTRKGILTALGLSQPTVTRAVQALLKAGFLSEVQPDTQTGKRGRGRPTTFLELSRDDSLCAGIALHCDRTYLGLFNLQGHPVDEQLLPAVDPRHIQEDIASLLAALTDLLGHSDAQLIAAGVVAPPTLANRSQILDALGMALWTGIEDNPVKIVTSDIASAIVASEMPGYLQHRLPTAVLYDAAGSLSAAISTPDCVEAVPVSSSDANTAGVDLIETYHPQVLILAGDRFLEGSRGPQEFVHAWKTHCALQHKRAYSHTSNAAADNNATVNFRTIPSAAKIDQAVARAIALDQVWRDPLSLKA